MNTALHTKRARLAWPLLLKRAKSKKPYTYGELAPMVGAHHRAASYFLGVIQKYCDDEGWPALQALAVNAKTKVPGRGYIGSRAYKAHQKELSKVSATNWPKKAPF